MNLIPYLTFGGTCESALNFYKDCLSGEIVSIQHFDSGPMSVPEDYKKNVLHGILKFGSATIMASDSMPGEEPIAGNNISLSIDMTDETEMEKIFSKLGEGGKITMPLQDTFWGARFGMLSDQFGINWMFNCEKKK